MTDEQLTWIFQNRLSSHNGFKCCRLLKGCALYPSAPRCEGQTIIIKGRLRFTGTCGEPCSFICDDADSLQKDISTLLQYAKVIDESRGIPSDVGTMGRTEGGR